MNRYILIRRLMGPSILLLLGTVALLHEAHLVSWGIFVPLLLILIGLLKLAERAALAAVDDTAQMGGPYQAGYYGAYAGGASSYTGPGASQAPPQAGPAGELAPGKEQGTGTEGGLS